MPFAFQNDELGMGNLSCQIVRCIPMSSVGGTVVLIIADEHKRGNSDVFQSMRVVMRLARQNKM